MKQLILCACAFLYTVLLNAQIVLNTSNFKPYDTSLAWEVIKSTSNAYNRAIEQFSINYDKAQEFYSNGNYTAAKMYLNQCNRINSKYNGKICDQQELNKSIKQVDDAIEYQEQMKSAIEKYNNGVDAYLKENYSTAVFYFNEAASWGIPEAQCMLGVCYEYGLGVTLNYQTAAEWYKKAASQGNENAKSSLLNLQMKTVSTPTNPNQTITNKTNRTTSNSSNAK